MFLDELLLQFLPEFHDSTHVYFLESGQESISILTVFQPLSYSLPHSTHRFSSFPSTLDSCLLHFLHFLLLLLLHFLLDHHCFHFGHHCFHFGCSLSDWTGWDNSWSFSIYIYFHKGFPHFYVFPFQCKQLDQMPSYFCLQFHLHLVSLH